MGEDESSTCWEHVLPSGGRVTLQAISSYQARVVGVNSTNPRDFLLSRWQPGNIINLKVD